MTAPPSEVNAGRTLASLLTERQVLSVAQGVKLVRTLAEQVAALHAADRIHGTITIAVVSVEDDLTPVLMVPSAGSVVVLDDGEWREMLPELQRLVPPELPAELDAARLRLEAAAIALDPRQIDLCQLAALFCRVLTGESASSYLHSARVKRKVPVELRSILERALGCDAQHRFPDAGQFLAELNAIANQPGASVEGAEPPVPAASVSDVKPASRPTGDTTPSFVSSGAKPDNTSVAPGKPADGRRPSEAVQTSALAAQGTEPPLPFVRLGQYEIMSRIGRGGMGDVYRGFERTLDRQVAVKVLPAEFARSDDFVRRFRTEATAVAKLNHPNIVPVYFIGEDQGHHFYVMQYVEGESLADLLARRERLNVEETLPIVEQALAGLAAAHERGMVHRDIKPGNILLDCRSRRALLADFGLVKSLASSVSGKTATGVVMGTADYISPEQGRGLAVDGRSDLYSIGVLLYQMLSGRLPFEADNATSLIFQHVYEQPQPLANAAPHVPAAVVSIIEKLLAKSPADRHQSVTEVLADLRAFRKGEPLPSQVVRPPGRPTSVVQLPAFDDEDPLPPAGLTNLTPGGWWERTRDRAKSLFVRHAPEAIKQLQNTQQQVDGAVANYERRQRDIQELVNDAASVLAELQKQAREQHAAALAANERAVGAPSSAEMAQAREQQAACERSAAELDRQIAEQQEQLESIHLRQAQVQAMVQQLRSQRDILNARLKTAGAGAQIPAGHSTRRRWVGAGFTIAAAAAAALLIWIISIFVKPASAPMRKSGPDGVSNSLSVPVLGGESPFEKVQLYAVSGNELHVLDAFTGAMNSTLGGAQTSGNFSIKLRADGMLFGYQGLPGDERNVGQLVTIDPRTGAQALFGRDGIANFNPARNPPDRNLVSSDTINSFLWILPSQLATQWGLELFLAVQNGPISRLYAGNPVNGSTVPANGEPWGNPSDLVVIGKTAEQTGHTTGMESLNRGEERYGVTETGLFFNLRKLRLLHDYGASHGFRFTSLTLGPQEVNGGAYADLLFATTTSGKLVAFDPHGAAGNLQAIFAGGSEFATTKLSSIGGIAFVPAWLVDPVESEAGEPDDAEKTGAEPMRGKSFGQVRDDNGLQMKLVWCPAGEFMMGNGPVPVKVFLSRGYWIGKYETTQSEWEQVMKTAPWKGISGEGADFPATSVTWSDAANFCRKLTEQERQAGRLSNDWEYALPTDAQWERACRANTDTAFSFGDDESKVGGYGWGRGGQMHPHQVGQKKPNPWGLFDTYGNVWEWCRDIYSETPPGGRDPLVTPRGESGVPFRVHRGGGFDNRLRATPRAGIAQSYRDLNVGFRVALSPVQ